MPVSGGPIDMAGKHAGVESGFARIVLHENGTSFLKVASTHL